MTTIGNLNREEQNRFPTYFTEYGFTVNIVKAFMIREPVGSYVPYALVQCTCACSVGV